MIDRKTRNTALLVAGCFFMENLDGTIVTTAVPAIGSSLDASAASVSLVVTVYMLTLAVLIPLSGWLTQRLGARPVFLSAIAIFTLASLGCGLSQSLPVLVGMRVLQGIGGAMMVPVGRMAVLARTQREDLIQVTAYIIWPGLIAPVIAPLAGGLLTEYASWHWMFLINIPLGVLAFWAAWSLIDDTDREATAPLDLLGVALTCTGLGGLTWGAHMIGEETMSSAQGATVCAVSLAVLALAVWHLLRDDAPLLNLRTLQIDTFRAATAGFFVFAMVVWSMPFLLPLLYQQVFDWSPIRSGAAVLWIFAGNITIKPATTWMLNRFGFRANILLGTIGVVLSIASFAWLRADTPFVLIAITAFISGVFRSIGFTAYNTIAFSDVPQGPTMRQANALYATMQQMAGGLGIVVTMLAVQAGVAWGGEIIGSGTQGAYSFAFLALATVSLVPVMLGATLRRDAGDALRRR